MSDKMFIKVPLLIRAINCNEQRWDCKIAWLLGARFTLETPASNIYFQYEREAETALSLLMEWKIEEFVHFVKDNAFNMPGQPPANAPDEFAFDDITHNKTNIVISNFNNLEY